MTKRNFVCLCVFISLCIMQVSAQDRKALETEKAKLQKEIELTTQRIHRTTKNIDVALHDVKTIEAEIRARRKMLQTLEAELHLLDEKLLAESKNLETSQMQLEELKTNYAELLRNAYLSKQVESPLLFLFSARNLNHAFRRLVYLRQLDRHRKQQFNQLAARQDSISQIVSRIEEGRKTKEELQGNVEEQEAQFKEAANAKESLIQKLRGDEKQLRKRLEAQEAESKQLAAEIDRIIRAEMAKKTTAADMPAAPELAKLTSAFHENKGKLPWPVKKGIVTGKFGTQPHPVLRSIKITNNGIDFSVEGGTKVMSVFDGIVVGKKFIPGFDQMVIIQHGNFYTVYSKLAEAYVDKGDRVTTQQVIGKVSNAEGKSELHFELWQEKQLYNPELWIAR